MLRGLLDRWILFSAFASAAILAIAHAFETFGGYAPCALCLHQREVYWAALTVAVGAILIGRFWRRAFVRRVAGVALVLVFLFGAGLAAYHAGVEWKWWPGPTTCAGAGAVSTDAMADLLSGKRIRGPACDHAAWVFLGLSMAGWNALASLGLTVLSLLALRRRPA